MRSQKIKNFIKKKRLSLGIISIFILGFAVFCWSLKNDFVYDDISFIVKNEIIKKLSNTILFFTSKFSVSPGGQHHVYRPLRTLSFALDFSLWGLKPWGYRLTNILLHIFTSITLFFILKHLFEKTQIKHSWSFSFISTLLFLLHPLHTETVYWISCRGDILSGLFALLSFLFYIKKEPLENKQKIICIIFLWLSLLSKESSVILAPSFILYDYLFRRAKKDYKFYIYVILSIILFFCIRYKVLGTFLQGKDMPLPLFKKLSLWVYVIGLSIFLMIFPYKLCSNYMFTIHIPQIFIILSFVLLGAIIFFVYRFYKKGKFILVFLISWVIFWIIPTFAVPVRNGLFTEHFLYMSIAGFTPLVVLLLSRYFKHYTLTPLGNVRTLHLIILVFFIFYTSQDIRRAKVWKNELTLWEDVIKSFPQNYRARMNVGSMYQKNGDFKKAIRQFMLAVKFSSSPYEASLAYNNLGVCLGSEGFFKDAERVLKKSIQLNPKYATAYINLGNLYYLKKQYSLALETTKKAIELNPHIRTAWMNLAQIYEESGSKERMLEEFKKLAQKFNFVGYPYFIIGCIYMDQNKLKEALDNFKTSIKLTPGLFESYFNIGNIYLLQGKIQEALRFFHLTLKLNPSYKPALENIRKITKRGLSF